MQLAVWNLVYDTDWSLSAQSAYRDFSTFRGQADSLLAGAMGVVNSRFDVFALERAGTQDFLLAAQRPALSRISSCNDASNPMPEPASLALVAVALAGLGVARRRGCRGELSRANASA